MTAYLVFYERVRKYLLKPGQHRHGVGEDTARCRNCMLAEEAAKMSPFEAFCWSWYQRTITPLIFEGGLLGRELDKLGMSEVQEGLFKRAINAIRQFDLKVQIADNGGPDGNR